MSPSEGQTKIGTNTNKQGERAQMSANKAQMKTGTRAQTRTRGLAQTNRDKHTNERAWLKAK